MREIVDRRAQIARGNEGYKKPKEIWDFIFWRKFWWDGTKFVVLKNIITRKKTNSFPKTF